MSLFETFYSQNFEDVLLSRVLSDVKKGFYVDVGCQHEERDSVTKHFHDRGWRGINIDPVEIYIREYDVRRADTSLACAAGSENGSAIFYVAPNTGWSSFDREHASFDLAVNEKSLQPITVPIRPLTSILDDYKPSDQEISFLKVDAEGYELSVFLGLDLAKYRPIVILAETTMINSVKMADYYPQLSLLLKNNNYHEVYFDGGNTWWLSEEEYAGRKDYFAHPVGIFDGYGPHQIRQQLIDLKSQLRNHSQSIESLSASLRDAERALRDAELDRQKEHERVKGMLSSNSWRLTRPLRWLKRLQSGMFTDIAR